MRDNFPDTEPQQFKQDKRKPERFQPSDDEIRRDRAEDLKYERERDRRILEGSMTHTCPDGVTYTWKPRVESPKCCPRCKQWIEKKGPEVGK